MSKHRLYRGKRVDNGGWVKGWYVFCRFHAYILPIHNHDDTEPCFDERWIQQGANDDNWFEVIPESVGQSTGLADKDGTKIYEGSGGVHAEYGRYYVKFGEYFTDNDNHNVGFYIQWVGEHQSRAYRKDVGWWAGNELLFNLNTTDNPELLESDHEED